VSPARPGSGLVTRRAVLGGAAIGTAGIGVGGAVGGAWAAAHATSGLGPVRGWYGATQPGIAERTRSSSLLAAFTCVAADRDALDQMFRDLGAAAQRLCDGVSEGPTDNPELPSPTTGILGDDSTKGTSVTVSVGASLFDHRYGLADRKPAELVRMPFLANDRLEDRWSHGDVLVQVAADRPDALAHALRQLMRATRASLILHWVIDGFSRAEPDERPGHTENRNMLGFKDGTANLDMAEGKDATDFVWVGADRNGGVEPAWTLDGSYQAVRLIRTLVERWDRASLTEQEQFIGREKFHGAPLGKTDEADDPDYADDPKGERIPLDAHIRLARPRTKDTEHQRILRKGFNYAHGFDAAGMVDQGLVFVSYQKTLDTFLAVQERIKGEPLEEYTLPFGGGFFFTLPGVRDAHDHLGRALLS
jgi:deferrochelatase/peroxidase EfeB